VGANGDGAIGGGAGCCSSCGCWGCCAGGAGGEGFGCAIAGRLVVGASSSAIFLGGGG